MEMIAVWVFLAFLVGLWGDRRGRNGTGYFILALIFSPILIGLLLAVLGPVVPLRKAPDPFREAGGRRVLARDLEDHVVAVGDQFGDHLCDRSEAAQVIERDPDHDAPPGFVPVNVRIFATASATVSALRSSNQARSSVGLSVPATSRAMAASSGVSSD